MSTNNESSRSVQHDVPVLGFTKNALQKLYQERTLLDQYVRQQKAKIDALHESNTTAFNQEKNRIKSSLDTLKMIQRKIGDDKVDGDGDDNGKENSNGDGIVQQKQSLAEKQIEVERQLANLHLEQKEVKKCLNGEFIILPVLVHVLVVFRICTCTWYKRFFIYTIHAQCKITDILIIYRSDWFKATSEEEKTAFTKAEEVRKSKERIEKSKQITVEELTIAVCKYRELGLDFIKGDNGALLFNFTKIDERNVDRIFSFRLLILEQDDEYLVEECCPQLKEEVVMRLVQELNQMEDYPSFMRGIRKAFVDYVADEEWFADEVTTV